MIDHIQQTCGLNTVQTPTIIYEDNVACVALVQTDYVKSNLTKHINPKFFYAHELRKMNDVRIIILREMCACNWYDETYRDARFRGKTSQTHR